MKYLFITCFLMLAFSVWAGGGSIQFTYKGEIYRYEAKPHFQIVLNDQGELAILRQ
jgi:hypothetical protein